MFFKKQAQTESNQDLDKLIAAMQNVIDGNLATVEVSDFANPAIAETFNKMITYGFKASTNKFTLTLNDSMEIIGNCECIKEMIEQVESQTHSIEDMSNSSQSLGNAINNISGAIENIVANTSEASETAKRSASNMQQSIQYVNEANEAMDTITHMILAFREKTAQINEIITIVKSIAKQSGLLALNASIEAARAGEAGKGFAVVANEVKELSNNTSASTEDVVRYVAELQSGIEELVSIIETTSKKLNAGNTMVTDSVADINKINDEISVINEEINSIYSSVETQSVATNQFVEGINNLSDAYNELLEDCMKTGHLMHKISRSVDNCRSDMARQLSKLTRNQWIRVFEVDHIIFAWRQYNSLQGYEVLARIQRPDECKLGKWIAQQKDQRLTSAECYRNMIYHHDQLHKGALDCWNATNASKKDEALKIFTNVIYPNMKLLVEDIHQVRELDAKIEAEDAAKGIVKVDNYAG